MSILMENLNVEIIKFIRLQYKQTTDFIPLHIPVFKGNEKKYLEDCIETSYVSSVGKFVDQFELEIAKFTGAKKAVACVNGTSALHLALKLVGVGKDDEVITQPLTFIATANAIKYCEANPVFVDVDIDTLGLSPMVLKRWLLENITFKKEIEHSSFSDDSKMVVRPYNRKTGRRVAACVPMHTFGHPARIDDILEICNEYNIPVVEDAAESLGSYYKGKHTGTFGKIGVLSFNGNKILTTGGGGMLLFEDDTLAKLAKHLSTQAKIAHPWEFVHDEIGFNFRMPNINAALGLAQLEQLPLFLKLKRQIALQYKDFFSNLNVHFCSEPADSQSNYWLNCILFSCREERDEFLRFSNQNGVMTRPAWKLMNELEMFSDCQTSVLINAEELSSRIVNIPSSVNL